MIKICERSKYICLAGMIILCILCSYMMVGGKENVVTMTEYDASETARQEALSGKTVTISSLEEFRLFQKHLNESANGLYGISFRQETDITPGDYHFTYDDVRDWYWIDRGSDRIGAVDRYGNIYDARTDSSSSIESLGLENLILQSWDDAKWFAGTYDGQGYYFRGFLLGIIGGSGSSYGGLFCDLGGGTISNVNVSDCCMHYCMSPIVNAMLDGTIENCHVQNIVGAADCGGGIAGLLWQGKIQDCTVEHCVLQFRGGYYEGDTYGGIGGVAGVLEQNQGAEIIRCQVSDAVLYGAEFSQVGVGGIVGVANSGGTGRILIEDCSASVAIHGGTAAGGIMGRAQRDGNGNFLIRDCVCSGSIVEDPESNGSDIGGMVGRIDRDVSKVLIENCISLVNMEKCSVRRRVTGTAGGAVGAAWGYCTLDRAVFAGNIQENENASAKGQNNYVGGMIGEMAAGGAVFNCVNFADIGMGTLQSNITGGLIGLVSSEQDIEVANSLNIGNVAGQTAGGLVGILDEGEATYRLHNDLALGETTGTVVGALAGEIQSGTLSYCYQRDDISRALGNAYTGIENCCQVSNAQLAGAETVYPIFGTGEYAGIYSVREVLNRQCVLSENQREYDLWEDTQAGYPLPEGMAESLPFALRGLDGEWDPAFPIIVTPRPTGTPRPSGAPSEETPEPSGTPSGETPEPSGTPSGETPEPSGTPSGETSEPSGTPSGGLPGSSSSPSGGNSGASASPSDTGKTSLDTSATLSPDSGSDYQGKQAVVAGFRGKSINNKSVVLTWKKNTGAAGYRIYRSVNRSSGYREIKKCTPQATRFRDRKCRPGKKYYYQIRAIYMQNGKSCKGKVSSCSVKLPYLKTPVYKLSKGTNDFGEKYLQITMRKYAGKYIDVYLKKKGGHYKKVSMASHKIAAYRGKIRFTYQRSGVKYWCKLRTYRIKNGKKQYSGYSKVKKIRL